MTNPLILAKAGTQAFFAAALDGSLAVLLLVREYKNTWIPAFAGTLGARC